MMDDIEPILIKIRYELGEDYENAVRAAIRDANLKGYREGLAQGHTDAMPGGVPPW